MEKATADEEAKEKEEVNSANSRKATEEKEAE